MKGIDLMKSLLKKKLLYQHIYRLCNLSPVAYQHISSDWYFKTVPIRLLKLWYSNDEISFTTLSFKHNSKIEFMSKRELIIQILHEHILITRLKKFFRLLYRKEVKK